MKQIYALLLLFIFGCNTTKDKVEGNAGYDKLPTETKINMRYECYEACSTYYYFAEDTLSPILAKVLWVDDKGNEKEEKYISYESYVPATSLSIYDSLGRRLVRYYRIDGQDRERVLTKTFYYYDTLGHLLKSVTFDYQRRIKKGTEKGIASSGGCIITEDDYEKAKSWELETVWNYTYDNQGKLIEKISPKINSTQNRYLYKYDSAGRLLEEQSMEGKFPVWTEKYIYTNNGYEFTRTWFDNDGTRRKNWDNSLVTVDTFRYKTDKNKNVINESVIEGNGRVVSTDAKYYDAKNRIIRHEIYDEEGKLLGFYIHKYLSNSKPLSRNFIVAGK